MKRHREIVASWLETDELLESVRPERGLICFPHVKNVFEPAGGLATFYYHLLHEYGAYAGPGY
jgi:hypothetical protein